MPKQRKLVVFNEAGKKFDSVRYNKICQKHLVMIAEEHNQECDSIPEHGPIDLIEIPDNDNDMAIVSFQNAHELVPRSWDEEMKNLSERYSNQQQAMCESTLQSSRSQTTTSSIQSPSETFFDCEDAAKET